MRDLIAAFNAAARERMTEAGWRRRGRGGIFTLDLGDGFEAWVGLNTATRYHPLQINPVAGLAYVPLERLLAELLGEKPVPGKATLSRPIGYLTPYSSFLQLKIATPEAAGPAAEELVELVIRYGLPHSRRYASPDRLLAALEEGGHVGNPGRANLLIPALHLLRGEADRATSTAQQHLLRYGNDLSMANVEEYHRFARALVVRHGLDLDVLGHDG
ncbi:hypothetical protein ACFZAU_36675 [Streptomyces sp. NPDC008238]